MSKIEEALKKAHIIRPSGKGGVSTHYKSNKYIVHDTLEMFQPYITRDDELENNKIIYSKMKDENVLNSFRELRTTLIQRMDGNDHVIMITPVNSGGGGCFVATNLAAAFALNLNMTSVLVDCNMTNTGKDNILGKGNRLGILDYLSNDKVPVKNIIHATGIRRLRLIPRGNKDSKNTEYFSTKKLSDLINELKYRYRNRYIIIDAPPISKSADTRILGELCEHVLLVATYGKTVISQLEESIRAIGSEKVVGVVFNDKPQLPGNMLTRYITNQTR